MYHVLDVCKYVINYSNKKNYGVSCLKLQKLLYFIQGYFMIIKDTPCFNERIEAWDFGPVVPVAYQEYKKYASTDIPFVDSDVDNTSGTSITKFDEDCILDEDKTLIDTMIEIFAKHTATDLVAITQKQEPWKNGYSKYQINEITTDSLKKYFSKSI